MIEKLTVTARAGDQKQPTLRDVAALAEVDPSVVSRVLSNDPRLSIGTDTRLRVLAAAKRLEYRPNMQARGLRLRRTWTIGFVLPDINNPVYSQIVHGAHARAEERGYALAIGSPLDGQSVDHAFGRLLAERRFDGLLVASGFVEDARMLTLAAGTSPIVVVNRRVQGIEGSVVVDDQRGAEVATNHLLDLGHARLAHIGGPRGIDTSLRREAGFREAAMRRGIVDPLVVAAGGFPAQAGYEATLTVLDQRRDVTGIFAASVMLALGAIRALRVRRRRVPEDVSVVGMHDFPLAEFIEPPLTTVAMPLRELGGAAVEMVLAQADGEPARSAMVDVTPKLIVRASTTSAR
jgi:LacI family transcriptional regulator